MRLQFEDAPISLTTRRCACAPAGVTPSWRDATPIQRLRMMNQRALQFWAQKEKQQS